MLWTWQNGDVGDTPGLRRRPARRCSRSRPSRSCCPAEKDLYFPPEDEECAVAAHPERRAARHPGRLGPLRRRRRNPVDTEVHRRRAQKAARDASSSGRQCHPREVRRLSVDPVQVDAGPGGAGPQPLAPRHPARGVGPRPAPSSGSSAGSGPTRSWATTTPPTTCATSTSAWRTCSAGPIEVEGAEPGDLLVVDILDLGPCQPPQEYGDAPGQGWGYTGIFAKANGGGFLTDHFPDAYKAIWDFHGQDATSRHIPGVRYTGITHPGLFGTAPSAELLAEWNRREQALIDTNPDRVPPLALPPLEDGVLAGTLQRRRAGAGRPRGGAHGPGPGERRQPRHQELHPRQPGLLPGARGRREALRRRPALLARATARSRSAAPSRWAASSTSASTSSRAA